jgi:putative methionine-R-sulfoxide reductase with GAF domain
VSTRGLDGIDQILARGGEPDDVLRSVVDALADEPGIAWAGIAFLENGRVTLGPHAGTADESRRVRVPVTYEGVRVGEVWIDGDVDQSFLGQLAVLISAHVLIGWDTRGEHWDP